jgi:hypothetical protein
MKTMITMLGLMAACCIISACANKAAEQVMPAQEMPVSTAHDYKGEVKH